MNFNKPGHDYLGQLMCCADSKSQEALVVGDFMSNSVVGSSCLG